MVFEYFAHRRACATKQQERRERIESLPAVYHEPLSAAERGIVGQLASETVRQVQAGALDPVAVLHAYAKKALRAHAATNCLTEVLVPEAEQWARECSRQGPLAGMPVSLKDTAGVAGWDACIGYSAWVGRRVLQDSGLVRLLRDAGAVPFVKTNVPITLLSLESNNDVFGRTTNPHHKDYTPGGSTGGEAALLAYGGSRLGIGTDVAGSVRCPAHFSGIYTIKASMHRFPKTGNGTSIPGQIGIPAVYSPMTRTLADLEFMWRAIMSMKPWTYDHSCVPIPWREVELFSSEKKKLRWGVMWTDGIIEPSPACRRALQEVVTALEADGHEIVEITPPDTLEALTLGSQLIYSDAGKTVLKPTRRGEWMDTGVAEALRALRLPGLLRRLYAWYWRHVRGDALYAALLDGWREQSTAEFFALVARREAYRARWFELWNAQALDFVLAVPNSLPAPPHDGMKYGWSACGYTFLFNILDYSAGVLPVTHVDRARDALRQDFRPANRLEAKQYKLYDADRMHGLPVGVQVVGRRLEEEKVLEGMKLVESVLASKGQAYQLLEVD